MRSNQKLATYGLVCILLGVGIWAVFFRPLPACTIADRAGGALAQGNYKKFWRYMGEQTRAEFDGDRSAFLMFADELIEPVRGNIDWSAKVGPAQEGDQPCRVSYGKGFKVVSVDATDTGRRDELVSHASVIAYSLYLAQFDLKEEKEKDPLFPTRALLNFLSLHRELYASQGWKVRYYSPLHPANETVEIDRAIAMTKERVEVAEARLRKAESGR